MSLNSYRDAVRFEAACPFCGAQLTEKCIKVESCGSSHPGMDIYHKAGSHNVAVEYVHDDRSHMYHEIAIARLLR